MRADVLPALVVGVACEASGILGELLEVVLEVVGAARRPWLAARYLFGVADSVDDVLHRLDVHGRHARFAPLPQQFCHAMLYVVGNLRTAFLPTEMALHTPQVALEQIVGVLVDIILYNVPKRLMLMFFFIVVSFDFNDYLSPC